jgi:peptide/nickel transport system substrate-binding protein
MLRLGSTGDIAALEPFQRSPASFDTIWMAFDRLIQYDPQLKPQPMLAESWDLSSDAKQIKLNLRKGVEFHSGRELTSEDVKYTLLRARDPKLGSAAFLNSWSNWFTTIDTSDKYSIVLKSEMPRPTMFDFFEWMNIVDQQSLEAPDANTRLVGTGPFKFIEWAQGDHLTFAKNPSYWQSGHPYLDGFTASIIETNSMLLRIEAGAQDIARLSPARDMARLKADPQYQILSHPYSGSFFEFGIQTHPPTDNKKTRQALNYAIDRKRFSEAVMLGTTTPQSLPWDRTSPAFDATKSDAYAFDLDKAKSLLREAGVSELEIDADIIAGAYPQLIEFAQIYQADLAKIGVTLTVQPMDLATWLAVVRDQRAFKGTYAANDLPTNLSPSTFISSSRSIDSKGNHSNYQSERWTMLSDAVAGETDAGRQKQLYSDINDLLLDESWCVPISNDPIILTGRSYVRGVTPTFHGGYLFTDSWLDT